MGLAIKQRKKYVSHKKRWDKKTIVDEEVLVNDYALKSKTEIRRYELLLSKYKGLAKDMNSKAESKEGEGAKHFIEKLKASGILTTDATSLDEVLDIKVRNLLERRLSNIVYKQGLAKSPLQARQFVVHGHVKVGGKLVTAPSYLVTLAEEATVEFDTYSNLADENHPERRVGGDGMEAAQEEMAETPVAHSKDSFDEKEDMLDEEELDEVKE